MHVLVHAQAAASSSVGLDHMGAHTEEMPFELRALEVALDSVRRRGGAGLARQRGVVAGRWRGAAALPVPLLQCMLVSCALRLASARQPMAGCGNH